MSELPEPLTPADCDLRGLPFMPLDVMRVLDSDLFALASGDEFKAAFALWCKSWLQVPAASLPDDPRVLAHLSGAGSRWSKVKAMALRGWIRCRDGRLYHPVVAEKAREAWEHRLAQRARANKRWSGSGGGSGNATSKRSGNATADAGAHATADATASPTAYAAAMQGTGTVYTSSLRSDGRPEPAAPPPDARTTLWTEGLARLRRITGKPDGAARGLLGRFLRDARDDCALVASLLHEAEAARIGDPVPWLTAAIQARTGQRQAARGKAAIPDWWMQDAGLSADGVPQPAFDLDGHAETVQ